MFNLSSTYVLCLAKRAFRFLNKQDKKELTFLTFDVIHIDRGLKSDEWTKNCIKLNVKDVVGSSFSRLFDHVSGP